MPILLTSQKLSDEVFSCLPQDGHLKAESLTFLHSGQLTKAIKHPLNYLLIAICYKTFLFYRIGLIDRNSPAKCGAILYGEA
jgi:hypothetical protein